MNLVRSPDLLSCVVLLRTAPGERPRDAFLGREIHAFFLHLVASVDPGLASQIHDAPSMKPFTVSPLLWDDPHNPWFRITTFAPRVAHALSEAASAWEGRQIRLADGLYRVEAVITDRRKHPWAAASTYHDLWDHYTQSWMRPGAPITLQFYTPTTFRRGRQTCPLPDPGLVFQSLLAKWNAFSPRPISNGMKNYIDSEVSVGRYSLETNLLDLGRDRRLMGFSGACDFTASDTQDERFRHLRMLAEFAFYAGVGHKATMGMGMVAPVRPVGRAA